MAGALADVKTDRSDRKYNAVGSAEFESAGLDWLEHGYVLNRHSPANKHSSFTREIERGGLVDLRSV